MPRHESSLTRPIILLSTIQRLELGQSAERVGVDDLDVVVVKVPFGKCKYQIDTREIKRMQFSPAK